VGVSGRPVIVVIDDDPSMRALVRLHLAGGGCDVHMPRMTGLELLADLKSDPLTRDVPVVLLTGDDDVVALAKAVGAADCLRKPIAAKRLLETTGAFVPRLL
jgi:CheY-like chemotaxis protein